MKNTEKRKVGDAVIEFLRKNFGKLTDLESQRIFCNLYNRFRKSGK